MHLSVIYVDDSFLLGETFSECHKNVYVTVKLLEMLGSKLLFPSREIYSDSHPNFSVPGIYHQLY